MHSDPFKEKAIRWADQYAYCCVLDSNGYADVHGRYDYLIAAGSRDMLQAPQGDAFHELKAFYERNRTWMFGYLGYDLKNQLEKLDSANQDGLCFPDLFFFVPEHVIGISDKGVEVLLGSLDILDAIARYEIERLPHQQAPFSVKPLVCQEDYIKNVEAIKEHIHRGDVYELTYCQEFFAENACINPLNTYLQLQAFSPTPFSGYLKIQDKYILCASPERFLRKSGTTLISQPIKGTAPRGNTEAEDSNIKMRLAKDLKEQTENVMIVDLVRNDLTRSALSGTVKVPELFGIYTFPQVHQMISTITCELAPEVHFIEAIQNTFPMGSMTGAPKVRAMELIETYESSKRGAYSGAMGYIEPEGDFDLNVIIRSILYNADRQYLSFQVGGAITNSSDAEKEYQECLLKASAMLKTIKGPY
jgi:para-aminobenzoate synthetase component 1